MSIYSKYGKKAFIDNDKSPRMTKKKYTPYSRHIQKKQYRFDQDYYYIHLEEKCIEAGVNKESIYIDCPTYYDHFKDGN